MSNQGRPRKVTDDELLQTFLAATDPVLTTSEVATKTSLSQRAVFDRLKELSERGILERKEVGARGAVWWIALSQIEHPSLNEGESIVKQLDPEYAVGIEISADGMDLMDRELTFDGPQGANRDEIQRRKRAVRAVYEYLGEKDHSVRKSEVISNLYREYSAGYENPHSWWQELIRPYLKAVSDVSLTESGHAWQRQ